MSADVVFNGGDEIRQPFLVMVDGQTANLTGFAVSALIYNPFVGEIVLDPDNGGLIISSLNPAEGQPHGTFVVHEVTSKQLPAGAARAYVRIVVVDPAGVTMSTEHSYFTRLI